jgi:hypothetical protein
MPTPNDSPRKNVSSGMFRAICLMEKSFILEKEEKYLEVREKWHMRVCRSAGADDTFQEAFQFTGIVL